MLHGYDIANHQAGLKLALLDPKPEFIIAKVSQDAAFKDREFVDFRTQARQLECGFGGYHYGDNQVTSDALYSADFFNDWLGHQQTGEVAALDVENDSGHGGFLPGDHFEWVLNWGERFTYHRNYKPKLYISKAGINDFGLNKPAIAEVFDLWYAYWLDDPNNVGNIWPKPPAPFESFKLWQYNTDTIDKNKFDGTLAEFRAAGMPSPDVSYEDSWWGPMQKLADDMLEYDAGHVNKAFHAAYSNIITLHKIARGTEAP